MNYEEIKKFIEDNCISSRKELRRKFNYKYKLFCKLSDTEKDELLPIQKEGPYINFKILPDFQNFIDINNIKSNEEFYKNYAGLYNKCRSTLTLKERLSLKFKEDSGNSNWSLFNTLQDFQDFINLHNIQTNEEFVENYPGLYSKYLRLVPKDQRLLKFPLVKEKPFSRLEDFQRYIDENNIQTYKEFRKSHRGIYSKYLERRINWSTSELIFPIDAKKVTYAHLKTNEDFQKYIDENNIESKSEFRKNASLSSRYYRVVPKEFRHLVFKIENRHLYEDEFSAIEDFQSFIDENKILRPIDFKNNYPKIYDRFCRIISAEEKQRLVYNTADESRNRSYGERYLMQLFTENSIEYVSEKTFPNLRGSSNCLLRYDLYLPEYNILIEYHGEQHFNRDTPYSSDTLIKNDKKKYDYAVNSGIDILYFTLCKSSLEKFGYFTEVITDSDILIEKIKKISLTN